jgi:hypothetical protein
MERSQHDTEIETEAPSRSSEKGNRQVRLSIRMKEFDIPPIRDAVVIGRRASIGPHGLFESLDRMLPGAYELTAVKDHEIIEAVILRKRCLSILDPDRLIKLIIQHTASLMHDSSIIQVELDSEVIVHMEFES